MCSVGFFYEFTCIQLNYYCNLATTETDVNKLGELFWTIKGIGPKTIQSMLSFAKANDGSGNSYSTRDTVEALLKEVTVLQSPKKQTTKATAAPLTKGTVLVVFFFFKFNFICYSLTH